MAQARDAVGARAGQRVRARRLRPAVRSRSPSTPTRPPISTTRSYSIDGSVIARSNSRGRAWLPMRSASAKPRLTTSSVRSPLRSSSALVATVVPIFTASTTPGRDRRVERDAEHRLDAGDGGVAVAAGVLAEAACGWTACPSGCARDDVGEGAAAIDPELPGAVCHCAQVPVVSSAKYRQPPSTRRATLNKTRNRR